jgi:hypothetical protein
VRVVPLSLTCFVLCQFVRSPSCVYTFTVIGVSQDLVNTANISFENIIRKEFCWLTGEIALA